MGVLAGHALGPRIDLSKLLAIDEALEQLAPLIGVLDDRCFDALSPDAFGPFVDALEISALFAIELGQRRDNLDHLLLCLCVT